MFLPTAHRPRPLIRLRNPFVMLFILFEATFWALAATCFLMAMHRIASSMKTGVRIKALEKMGDAYTDEQREVLIHKIKVRTLGPL